MPSTTLSSTSRSAREGVGDQGGEDVVVAEGDLHQLVGADGVVLVDDRNAAELVHGVDRVAEIEKSRAVVDVFAREQQLRDM